MVKVSVILPIYNVAKYLPKCLDSILNQTLQDIEVICVNDESPDNSLDILNQYAKIDDRIIIINQPNSGPGRARNNGIKKALGEYIAFVDPDDWVDKGMLEIMYNTASTENADLVECGVMTHNEKTHKTKTKLEKVTNISFNWRENPHYVFQGITAGWGKLCRRELIEEKNIEFANGRCAEDQIFTIALRLAANKIVYCAKPFYHYLIRKTSITQKPSKANLQVPYFLADIENMLKKGENYNELEEFFVPYAAALAEIHYNKTPKENREEYKALCKNKLDKKIVDDFMELVRSYKWNEKLFSVRYRTKKGKRYRIISLLGLRLKY